MPFRPGSVRQNHCLKVPNASRVVQRCRAQARAPPLEKRHMAQVGGAFCFRRDELFDAALLQLFLYTQALQPEALSGEFVQAQTQASPFVDKRAKVDVRGDILFAGACQRALAQLVLEIAEQRPALSISGIERPGLVTIVDGENETTPQETCLPLYPTERIQVDFRAPSFFESAPGAIKGIQVACHCCRTRLA